MGQTEASGAEAPAEAAQGQSPASPPKTRLHLGKAWHGWPAFLIEIGTIVLGILIALAVDQTAQGYRDSRDAAAARAAVRAEVAADVSRVADRAKSQGCIDQRLDALQAIIESAGPGGKIVRPSWVGRPPRWGIERQRWDAATQSGRASNFTVEEQGRYGFVYTALDYFYEMENREQEAWSKLGGLEGVERLSDDGRLAMGTALAEARFYNGSIRQVSDLLIRRAGALDLRPAARADFAAGICLPIDLAPEAVRARRAAGEVF